MSAASSTESTPHVFPSEAWDAIASGYDRHVAPQEADLAAEALDLVGLRAGERLLDVAAGTGGLSLPAARRGARVVATDWSPAMIERLRARAADEALADVVAQVMDCHALDFPDGSFDVTASQFGVMLVPDQQQALREMVRVTRPGGRVLLVAYGAPGELEFLGFFIGALRVVVPEFPGVPEDPPPLEFQAADPDVLRRRLVDVGLEDVTVERRAERPAFRSGRELWDWVLNGNPLTGALVGELDPGQRATLLEVLDGMVRERSSDGGPAVLANAVNIGIGRA